MMRCSWGLASLAGAINANSMANGWIAWASYQERDANSEIDWQSKTEDWISWKSVMLGFNPGWARGHASGPLQETILLHIV